MKSNIEDIVDKIAYAKIYDALNSDISLSEKIDVKNVFNVIDDIFYSKLIKQNKMVDALRIYARILITNKSYMSMYLLSFIIKTYYECIVYSFIFVKCIKSFYNNTKEQNVIMLKSFDKILNTYLKDKPNEITHADFLYVFIKEDLNTNLVKDILAISTSYNFKNCISFFNILISKLY